LYHKTDLLVLVDVLRDKFNAWARNGSCVEDIWKCYKGTIFKRMKRYVPQNTLRKFAILNAIVRKKTAKIKE